MSWTEVGNTVLSHLDSEKMHVAARNALHLAEFSPTTLKWLEKFAYQGERFNDERLRVNFAGVDLENPALLGPGWDKNGLTALAWQRLGFAGSVFGTVTVWDQDGNEKPRQFTRERGRISLNRLGFNGPGMNTVDKNLARYAGLGIPIGISVGKNKEVKPQEAPMVHALVVRRLAKHASFIEINVSSPNTPGLRDLQLKAPLVDIAQAVNGELNDLGLVIPTFVKIAPELALENIDDVIDVVQANHLAGITTSNTVALPEFKVRYGFGANELGGIAGDDPEFRAMRNRQIDHIYTQTNGEMPIAAVGGVNGSKTAIEAMAHGATIVQSVTAVREFGPTLPGRITRGMSDFLDQTEFERISDVIGIMHREPEAYFEHFENGKYK